jgi:ribosomal protein S18 acetylase RimI-like enzyme
MSYGNSIDCICFRSKHVDMKTYEKKTGFSKSLEIKIREMCIDDVADVFHLGEELFTFSTFPNMFRTWDEFEVIDFFSSESEFCLVATRKGKIVGFLLSTIIEKRSRKYGYLVWFGVDGSVRRKGVASKLFDRMKRIMKKSGVNMIIIDTQADNVEALEFFRKKGFSSPQAHVYLSLNID